MTNEKRRKDALAHSSLSQNVLVRILEVSSLHSGVLSG